MKKTNNDLTERVKEMEIRDQQQKERLQALQKNSRLVTFRSIVRTMVKGKNDEFTERDRSNLENEPYSVKSSDLEKVLLDEDGNIDQEALLNILAVNHELTDQLQRTRATTQHLHERVLVLQDNLKNQQAKQDEYTDDDYSDETLSDEEPEVVQYTQQDEDDAGEIQPVNAIENDEEQTGSISPRVIEHSNPEMLSSPSTHQTNQVNQANQIRQSNQNQQEYEQAQSYPTTLKQPLHVQQQDLNLSDQPPLSPGKSNLIRHPVLERSDTEAGEVYQHTHSPRAKGGNPNIQQALVQQRQRIQNVVNQISPRSRRKRKKNSVQYLSAPSIHVLDETVDRSFNNMSVRNIRLEHQATFLASQVLKANRPLRNLSDLVAKINVSANGFVSHSFTESYHLWILQKAAHQCTYFGTLWA
jgi:hypothetical protein